jgi:hypothetical protein
VVENNCPHELFGFKTVIVLPIALDPHVMLPISVTIPASQPYTFPSQTLYTIINSLSSSTSPRASSSVARTASPPATYCVSTGW